MLHNQVAGFSQVPPPLPPARANVNGTARILGYTSWGHKRGWTALDGDRSVNTVLCLEFKVFHWIFYIISFMKRLSEKLDGVSVLRVCRWWVPWEQESHHLSNTPLVPCIPPPAPPPPPPPRLAWCQSCCPLMNWFHPADADIWAHTKTPVRTHKGKKTTIWFRSILAFMAWLRNRELWNNFTRRRQEISYHITLFPIRVGSVYKDFDTLYIITIVSITYSKKH